MKNFLSYLLFPFLCVAFLQSCSSSECCIYPQFGPYSKETELTLRIVRPDGSNAKAMFPFGYTTEKVLKQETSDCLLEASYHNTLQIDRKLQHKCWWQIDPEVYPNDPRLILRLSIPYEPELHYKEVVECTLRNPKEWGNDVSFHLKFFYEFLGEDAITLDHPDLRKPALVRCEVNGEDVKLWLKREGASPLGGYYWSLGDRQTYGAHLTLQLPR